MTIPQRELLSSELTIAWMEIWEEYLLWRDYQISTGRYKKPKSQVVSMIDGFQDYICEVLILAQSELPKEISDKIRNKYS